MSFKTLFVGFAPVVCAALIMDACACRSHRAQDNRPPVGENKVTIIVPGREAIEVSVELADTPRARTRGLMERDRLDPMRGMLFVFPDERQREFWMKNTLIELDMIFIRADGSLLGCVERAQPMTETPRFVEGDSKYVLEVVGGFCREHEIGAGTKFSFNPPGLNTRE